MGYTYNMDRNTELLEFARGVTGAWWHRITLLYPRVGTVPIVKINRRLKVTAGCMSVEDRIMSLSFDFLDLYPAQFKSDIIPHELAHMVAYDVYGIGKNPKRNNWHGAEWCAIMGALGCEPSTYHNMKNPRHVRK